MQVVEPTRFECYKCSRYLFHISSQEENRLPCIYCDGWMYPKKRSDIQADVELEIKIYSMLVAMTILSIPVAFVMFTVFSAELTLINILGWISITAVIYMGISLWPTKK